MRDKLLHGALSLAKRGKYGASVAMLEGEIMRYRDSYAYYYILGAACLRAGDFGRAYTYLKSAHDIKNRDVNVLIGIAALNLKRGESGRAVDLYLKVLEIEPKNKKASYALNILKKYGSGDELRLWTESGKINKLYPPFPKEKLSARSFIVPGAVTLAVAALAAFSFYLWRADINPKPARDGFYDTALSVDEKRDVVETGGAYAAILTEGTVLKAYSEARKFFNEFKDNSARREINLILLSNASEGIKNRAKDILKFIDKTPQGFDTLTERFDYRDVMKSPELYSGCYVIWSGMTANIEKKDDEISFDLLIGYEERKELLGTVRVLCPFVFELNTERAIDVLGRVESRQGGIVLNAVSVHQR